MKLGYMHLAMTLRCVGDLEGVLRAFEKASANGAGGESVDRQRAMLLSEMGRPKEALDGAPSVPRERGARDVERAGHRPGRRAAGPRRRCPSIARAIEIDPSNARSPSRTPGIALLKLDQPEEARQNLERPLRLGKRHARAWNALGVAWMRLGDPTKAIEAWQTCIEINPEQYDALYNIGRVAGQLGDWKTARAALESFVEDGAAQAVRQGSRRSARRPRRHVPPRALSSSAADSVYRIPAMTALLDGVDGWLLSHCCAATPPGDLAHPRSASCVRRDGRADHGRRRPDRRRPDPRGRQAPTASRASSSSTARAWRSRRASSTSTTTRRGPRPRPLRRDAGFAGHHDARPRPGRRDRAWPIADVPRTPGAPRRRPST